MPETLPTLRRHQHLESLETYVPGLLIPEVASRFGMPREEVVKLASAENPLGTSPRAVAAVGAALADLHLYPDWRAHALREALAEHHGVRAEQVTVGAGETELIPLILRTFSEQGEEILFPIPTFPIYEQAAIVERRQPKMIPMDEGLRIVPEQILASVTEKTRVLILTSPNNPLSTVIDRSALEFILERISPDVLVVLDEAYVDYSEHGSQMDLLSRHTLLKYLMAFSCSWFLR